MEGGGRAERRKPPLSDPVVVSKGSASWRHCCRSLRDATPRPEPAHLPAASVVCDGCRSR